MVDKDLHDIVDIDKIEPKTVGVKKHDSDVSVARKAYTAVFTLPIAVSEKWQEFFQMPDPRSGIVHQVRFSFSENGREVQAILEHEPPPELIYVLRSYAQRANQKWEAHRKEHISRQDEEEAILKKLKESK